MQDVLEQPPVQDAPAKPLTIGDLIDQLTLVKKERSELTKLDKPLKEREDELCEALIELLDAAGTDGSRGATASVTISESVVPNVKDWPTFYEFIKSNDYFHLLNRAVNAASCRELFERDGAIPGVEPFTKRTLRYNAR